MDYILIAYKRRNGIVIESIILEHSNEKMRLEYLMECKKCEYYKNNGYELAIYHAE